MGYPPLFFRGGMLYWELQGNIPQNRRCFPVGNRCAPWGGTTGNRHPAAPAGEGGEQALGKGWFAVMKITGLRIDRHSIPFESVYGPGQGRSANPLDIYEEYDLGQRNARMRPASESA